jgi:hypothetical protein
MPNADVASLSQDALTENVKPRHPAGLRSSFSEIAGLTVLIPLATLLSLLTLLSGLLTRLLLTATLLLLAALTWLRVVLLLLVRVLVLLVHRELLRDLPPTLDKVPRKAFDPMAGKRHR